MLCFLFYFILKMFRHPQKVYFPGDPMPEKQLDIIRNLSDTKLKRRLTYKQYDTLKDMLAEVVQIFNKNEIRCTFLKYQFHKVFGFKPFSVRWFSKPLLSSRKQTHKSYTHVFTGFSCFSRVPHVSQQHCQRFCRKSPTSHFPYSYSPSFSGAFL